MATARKTKDEHADELESTLSPPPEVLVPRIRDLFQLHPKTRTVPLTALRHALSRVGPEDDFGAVIDALLQSPPFAPLRHSVRAILVETVARNNPIDTRIVWSRNASLEFIGRMFSWAGVDPVRLAQLELGLEAGVVFDLWDLIDLEDLLFPLNHEVFQGLYDSEDDSWVSVSLGKDEHHIWILSFWYRREGERARERARIPGAGDTRLLIRSLLKLLADDLVGAFYATALPSSHACRQILEIDPGAGTLVLTGDGQVVSASPGIMKSIAAFTGLSPSSSDNKQLLPAVTNRWAVRREGLAPHGLSRLDPLLDATHSEEQESGHVILRFPDVSNVVLLTPEVRSPDSTLTSARDPRKMKSSGPLVFGPLSRIRKVAESTQEGNSSNHQYLLDKPRPKPSQGKSIDSPEVQALLEERRAAIEVLLEIDKRILDAINFGEPITAVLFQRGGSALELLTDGKSRAVTIERRQKSCTLHPPDHPTGLRAQSTEPISAMQSAGGALITRADKGEVLLLQRRQRGRGKGATDAAVLTPPSKEGTLSVSLASARRLLRDFLEK